MEITMRKQDTPGNNLGPEPLLVWDLPTRLFHWLLVMLVIVSYVTGKTGGLAMQYHMWSGYAILTLLIFRFAWGFIGGRHARFSSFVRGPAAVWRYLRTFLRAGHTPQPGHNPLGGWSVLLMLLFLALQAGTGMFADDQIFTRGPLNPWVSNETAGWLTLIHVLNQRLLLALIIVHIGAVLFHLLVKRDNLVTPMITGYKRIPGLIETPAEKSRTAAAIITAILAAAAVYLLVR
jgi:cytochrome b